MRFIPATALGGCHNSSDIVLDIRPYFRYKPQISLTVKDVSRRHRLTERERFPRAGARHLRSRAAPGKRPAGMMTGLRLCRWTGTGGSG